jgi:outer membrane protein assembly factor BamE
MRFVLSMALALLLGGCELVFKLPTRQGNVIEQKELDKLQTGMTREQVKFLLGTPIAASPFREDRWDYTGYYKNPRGKVFSRTVSLYFEGDVLARMDGLQPPSGEGTQTPDLKAIEEQEKKAQTEAERAEEKTDSGIVITPK